MSDGILDGKKIVGTMTEELGRSNEEAKKLLTTFKEIITSAQNFRTASQGNTVVSDGDVAYKKANAAIKERERLLKAVQREEAKRLQATSSLSRNLAKERLETQRLNRENKERAILQNKEIGAYRKLNLERTKASKTLRDLIASEKASNAEIVKAQSNFDKLDGKIRKADAAVRDSTKNVGNYKSAFQGIRTTIRGLIGAFGLIEGIRFGARLVSDSIALAKEAKGVEFAFVRLGEAGEDAFNRVKESTRGLLSDLDIKTALVDFNNFNISLEETDTLFEFLAVRSAQTGKSVDSLRDSLVEGLSKESKLRIDNLGISTAQLNEELEKTPDFVQAVANIAKREVAEAGNILDSAANSTEKWNASWQNLKVSIGQAFGSLIDSTPAANFINDLNETQKALNVSWQRSGGLLERLQINLNRFTESGREANRQLVVENDLRKQSAKAVQEQINAYARLNGSIGPLQQGRQEQGSSQFSFVPPPETERLLSDINKELETQNQLLNEGAFSSREEASAIQEKIKSLEAERDAILGVENSRKQANKVIEGTINYYNQLIAKEKEFQNGEAKTRQEIEESEKVIQKYSDALERLSGLKKLTTPNIGFTNQNQTNSDGNITSFATEGVDGFSQPGPEDIQSLLEADLQRQEDAEARRLRILENSSENQKRILQSTLSAAQDIYGIDLQSFIFALDEKEAGLEDYASGAQETLLSLNDAILFGTLDRLDREREANERTLDLILADKTASDKKKEQAEAEYRKRDLELRKKQFKAEQKAAIARTVINTAVAIIQAYAQLGPIGGTIAGVLISALGTVQLATIKKQKPPEFFRGKKATDNFEGIGSVNERPGQRELGIDESGNVTMFPAGKHYRNIKKKDIIIPSMKQYDREIQDPSSETFKRVSKKYGRDADRRTALFEVRATPMDVEPMRRMFAKELRRFANRPIQNHITIKTPTKGYRV